MLIMSFSATPYTAFLWLPIVMAWLTVAIRATKPTVVSHWINYYYVGTLEFVQVLSLVLMVNSIVRSVICVKMQHLCVTGIMTARIIQMKNDVVIQLH